MERTNPLTSRRTGVVAGAILMVALLTSGFLAKRSVDPSGDDPPPVNAFAGMVRPVDVGTVTAPVPLTIAEVLVAVGDELTAEQPIARRDTTEEERAVAQLEVEVERVRHEVAFRAQTVAALEQSLQTLVTKTAGLAGQLALAERQAEQVPVRQAKDSPDRAEAAYEQALIRARRAESLAAAGLMPQQEVDEARLAVRLAADDLANAKQAAAAAVRVRDLETAQARARRDLAIAEQQQKIDEQRAALEQAQLLLKATEMRFQEARAIVADPYIRAPREGSVVELPVNAGDRLVAGALIARISRLDEMAVDVDVPPDLVNALRAGDDARIEVPAAGVTTSGRIRSIAPLPNDAGKYSVQVIFPNGESARLAGQTAHAWLRTGETSLRP